MGLQDVDFGTFSFADVEPGGPQPIPSGWRFLRIETWEETKTKGGKAPGTLMYSSSFSVCDGSEHDGRYVFDNFVMGGDRLRDTIARLKALLIAAGIDEDTINAKGFDPTTEWGAENLVGRQVDGKLAFKKATEDYDAGNSIRDYRPHTFGEEDFLS